MKNLKYIIVAAIVSFSGLAKAEEKGQNTIYIHSAKFSSSLVDKWIEEYSKVNPQLVIKQVDKKTASIDLEFVANEQAADDNDSRQVTYVGRYALLPVTAKENPQLDQLVKRKWNKKDIRNLFFIDDPLAEDSNNKKNKVQNQVTVYSSNGSASGAVAFASHFGYVVSDLRGKKISGDDIFLLNALQKDHTGVTFNNLSYIYDIQTRQLKKDIALLPLDIKKDQLEAIQSENIDETLSVLEKQNIELIPIQSIGFAYNESDNHGVKDFLRWVITDGQKYNHTYGFLNLDEKTLSYQQKQIEEKYFTSKY